MEKAVVLLSGGLDSATALAIAKDQGYDCYAISFDYDQRHRAELLAAERIAKALGVTDHRIIKLSLELLGGSALTDKEIPVPEYSGSHEIPITYVPARNTIFLSLALSWAEILNAYHIFIGANVIDYSGYPDCRPDYFAAFEKLAKLATKVGTTTNHEFKIQAPLLNFDKREIILVGTKLGIDYSLTISCYQADEEGNACGKCDSCAYRKRGFVAANLPDPTRYQHSAAVTNA